MTVDADLSGSLADPAIIAGFEWSSPTVMGTEFEHVSVRAFGDLAEVEWSATANLAPGTEATANGVVDLTALRTDGQWRIDISDVGRIAGLVDVSTDIPAGLSGRVAAAGDFVLDGSDWSVSGQVHGADLGTGDWRVASLDAVFDVDPDRLVLAGLRCEIFDGSVTGSAEVGFAGFDSSLVGELEWTGLNLARAPVDLRGAGRV